jgi:hypothetical protein
MGRNTTILGWNLVYVYCIQYPPLFVKYFFWVCPEFVAVKE